MEQLLESIWIQSGYAALFGMSGWFVWWFNNKRIDKLLDRLHGEVEKREEIIQQLMTFMSEQRDIIESLTRYKAMEDMLKQEIMPILDEIKRDREA